MDVSGNGRQQNYRDYLSGKSNPAGNSGEAANKKTQPNHLADDHEEYVPPRNGKSLLLDDQEIEILVGEVPLPIPGVLQAMTHLGNANKTALKCGKNPELFAVGLNELKDRGLLIYQLRWLELHHLVSSCCNRNVSTNVDAVFETMETSVHEAYTITANGERFLDLLSLKIESQEMFRGHESRIGSAGIPKPTYNSENHLLIYQDSVVKRFRWAAANQERVSMAFQEEGWPRRIDDPLMPDADICPKRRLHDTIKCLNRRQENQVLRFRGDGTGTGVLWEIWNQDSFESNGGSSKNPFSTQDQSSDDHAS